MATTGEAATRCFISYARQDNDDFDGVVDELSAQLAGRFEARTGRRLEVFIDRESIGWGQEWRGKINDAVLSATLFIPVVTMRYFASTPCREELTAFASSAQRLGVTELILPIILSGASGISADDERDEVRLIESLNYVDIEDAWAAGYESSDWKRKIAKMVKDLSGAISSAEEALASREIALTDASGAASADAGESNSTDVDALSLREKFQTITREAQEVTEKMQTFGEVAGSSMADIDFKALSPNQARARLIVAAGAIRGPADSFQEAASRFERDVSDTDAEMRALIGELKAIDHPDARAQVESMVGGFSGLENMSTFMEQLDSIVAMLQFASLVNVNLRQAVQPGIRAMQSMRNAVSTAQSWTTIS